MPRWKLSDAEPAHFTQNCCRPENAVHHEIGNAAAWTADEDLMATLEKAMGLRLSGCENAKMLCMKL